MLTSIEGIDEIGQVRRLAPLPAQSDETAHRLTVEAFLKHRRKRPSGVAPVTLEDMEAAIIGHSRLGDPGC